MVLKTIYEGENEYKQKLKELKQVKYFPSRWVTFYTDEKLKEKWILDKPHSEQHGGGAGRLRLVDEYPIYADDILDKDIFIGQDAFNKMTSLKLIKDIGEESYFLNEKDGTKWKEDYFSGIETNGNISPRLRKIDKYPWE